MPYANIGQATSVLEGNMIDQNGQISINSRRIWREGDHSYALVTNANGDAAKVRTNAQALLRYEEWLDIDRAVIEAATQRLMGIIDLRQNNLTYNLGSIGATISLWETASDMTEADISMSALTRSEKDTPAFNTQQVPVPIVHKDFQVELRRLVASRNYGASIDVTAAAIAGRVVAERSERMLFSGAPVRVDGATIYGYTTHPDRNTVDMAKPWNDPSVTGENIIADVTAMLNAARAAKHYGPFVIYVPTAYEGKLDQDYRQWDTRTIRERILSLGGVTGVMVADFLPGNNVVMVQMTRDVVDLAIAQDITTVQWSVMGGMAEEFKVMAVWVPRVKSTFDGDSGLVHLRPAA